MHLSRGVLAVALALLVTGCSEADEPVAAADDAVKQWAQAVTRSDWKAACDLSTARDGSCEEELRSEFDGDRLTFEGPAVNGGGTKPGESYFSLRSEDGTVFVTAVPEEDGHLVRLEAIVLRP